MLYWYSLHSRCRVAARVLPNQLGRCTNNMCGSPLILYYSRIKRTHNSIGPNRGILEALDVRSVRVINKISFSSLPQFQCRKCLILGSTSTGSERLKTFNVVALRFHSSMDQLNFGRLTSANVFHSVGLGVDRIRLQS